MFRVIGVFPLAMLSACATIMSGSDQTLTVSTTPPGASCTLDRLGTRVGAIPATPGSLRVDKSKNDLSVSCTKDGFQAVTLTQSSHFNGATFGNIIAGGVIGVVVDAASGANFNYPGDIRLELVAMPATTTVPVASAPIPDVQATPVVLHPVVHRTTAPSNGATLPTS